MNCPRCGKPSRVILTVRTLTKGTKRHHICRNGHRFTSYEKDGKRVADKESVR